MKTLKAYLVLVASTAVVAAAPAHAALTTYIASDVGANALGPNAAAEQGVFLGAAGPTGVITFESALPSGVTLSATTGSITNVASCGFALCGGNTTAGGSHYYYLGGFSTARQSATFTFATPISSFGIYVTGTQSRFGQDTITFTDAAGPHTIAIPLLGDPADLFPGGMSFVGFVDPGQNIFSVSINVGRDFIGLDDVIYSAAAPATPGPFPGAGLAGLAALTLAGLYARGRRA